MKNSRQHHNHYWTDCSPNQICCFYFELLEYTRPVVFSTKIKMDGRWTYFWIRLWYDFVMVLSELAHQTLPLNMTQAQQRAQRMRCFQTLFTFLVNYYPTTSLQFWESVVFIEKIDNRNVSNPYPIIWIRLHWKHICFLNFIWSYLHKLTNQNIFKFFGLLGMRFSSGNLIYAIFSLIQILYSDATYKFRQPCVISISNNHTSSSIQKKEISLSSSNGERE